MRALIAESDENLRHSIGELLLRHGYSVDTSENGFAALKKLTGVDVLLAGIDIGGINGLDLCTEARRRFPLLRVIVMTGCDSTWVRGESSRRGAHAIMVKPFANGDLLRHIQEVEGA